MTREFPIYIASDYNQMLFLIFPQDVMPLAVAPPRLQRYLQG